MSISSEVTRIVNAKADIRAAIEGKGVTVPDGTKLDGMPALIGGIEAGTDPEKAFADSTLGSAPLAKWLAPVSAFTYVCSHTNTSETFTVSVPFGDAGTVYLAAAALRNLDEPPSVQGWTQIAWIPDTSGINVSHQDLLVLRHVVSEEEANTTVDLTIPVVNGQRNYIIVLCLGDSDIVEGEIHTGAFVNQKYCEPELFEHSIVFCSSLSGSTGKVVPVWVNQSGGYMDSYFPDYSDGYLNGTRLCALYIPFLSQQPFVSPSLWILGVDAVSVQHAYCTVRLRPGTPVKYVYK